MRGSRITAIAYYIYYTRYIPTTARCADEKMYSSDNPVVKITL